jgi:hypothetical protein
MALPASIIRCHWILHWSWPSPIPWCRHRECAP